MDGWTRISQRNDCWRPIKDWMGKEDPRWKTHGPQDPIGLCWVQDQLAQGTLSFHIQTIIKSRAFWKSENVLLTNICFCLRLCGTLESWIDVGQGLNVGPKIFAQRLKLICSKKATKFCEIFLLLLTAVHTVKNKGKILQNFMAFSEYMNFKGTQIKILL